MIEVLAAIALFCGGNYCQTTSVKRCQDKLTKCVLSDQYALVEHVDVLEVCLFHKHGLKFPKEWYTSKGMPVPK